MKKMVKFLLVMTLVLSFAAIGYAEEADVSESAPAVEQVQKSEPQPSQDEPKQEPETKEDATPQIVEPTGIETIEIFDEDIPLSDGVADFAEPIKTASELDLSGREFRVEIRPNKTEPEFGEEVLLTSELFGYEGLKVKYQWQVDKGDGKGWKDVKKATGDSHTFTYNEKRANYGWRLVVTVVGPA